MKLRMKLMKTQESNLSEFISFCLFFVTITAMFLLPSCSGLNYETPSYQPTDEEKENADYGEFPNDYKKLVQDYMQTRLIDPYSAHYRYTLEPQKYVLEAATKEETIFCYYVYVYINAKNKMGGYTGEKSYFFFIKNNRIIKYWGGD